MINTVHTELAKDCVEIETCLGNLKQKYILLHFETKNHKWQDCYA